ncbi:MAG: polysaccharide export protein [Acidobacteriales bacterium]|nr:polysaccharide export protein [Terriglobales bacterium]
MQRSFLARRSLLLSILFFSSSIWSQSGARYPSQQEVVPAPQQSTTTTPQIQNNPGRERISNIDSDSQGRPRELDQRELDKLRIRNEEQYLEVEKPNEFQQFIKMSTGLQLPVFGSGLFKGVPSTFAPVDRVPVTADYVLGPGDEIMIRAWGQVDIDYRAVVDRVGNIYLPKIGDISVAGVKYGQLQPYLKNSIGRVFKSFDLNVTLGQLRSIQIFVVGQAKRPGSYTVSSLSTLVNALFASGGPSSNGSMRRIELRRDSKAITDFDLYDLLLRGDKSKDIPLLPGDVIYIPPVGSVVAVMGSVNVPAIYEVKEPATLKEVMQYAGGLTPTAAGQRATVERITDRTVRSMAEFKLDEAGLSRNLKDGDLITVLGLSARFDNAITLRGNVATPGRYPWKQGMRIKDLIPDAQALITREYWQKKGDLGKQSTETASNSRSEIRYGSMDNRSNPENGNQESSSDDATSSRQVQDRHSDREKDTDRIEQARASALVDKKLREQAQSELRNEVKRLAPQINWDYAVIQRLDQAHLRTRLIPFNLGRVILDGSEIENLPLEPGDVVTVFSQADLKVPAEKQTKLVRLEGEFNASGVYEVLPGETLRGLVERIGITPQAYLYGSEFTRESAREAQQKRFDEFVDKLELDVERNSSFKAQNAVSGEEAMGLKSTVDSQRRLVEKLRNARPSGRIVLGIAPAKATVTDIPDIALEDGDTLTIPYKPSMINVIGSVYSENSFLYEQNRNVGFYLHQAGGGKREADKSRIFIIRADGSILSKNQSAGWFSESFNNIKLMPGDTIVIPERLDKVSLLKGLKDWSQVVGQFALGIAAIQTLTR